MRAARDLRSVLRVKGRRGYYPVPRRPGRSRPTKLQRYYTVGGVVTGPRGARNWALNLVRREVEAGTYVSKWRLNAALDRMLASIF